MENIYEKKGDILRSPCPDKVLTYYHALFKRESELITYVTLARNTWKYHQTTINARILTFYDEKIAYIIDMDVIDISSDHPYYTKIEKGNYEEHFYFTDVLKPNGINDIRFMDCPLSLEVFLLMKKTIKNIIFKYPIINIMEKNDILPFDLIECIYNINDNDITKEIDNIINTKKDIETLKPFKVQSIGHGSKCTNYRVVLLGMNYIDENPDNNWEDLDESPYESNDGW